MSIGHQPARRPTTLRPTVRATLAQSYARCLSRPDFIRRLHARLAPITELPGGDYAGQEILLRQTLRRRLEADTQAPTLPRYWSQAVLDSVAESDPAFDRDLGRLWARALGTHQDRSPATLFVEEHHAA